MVSAENKKSKKASKKSSQAYSLLWLVFAAQQFFSGYVLLTNFDNYFVVASAITSLGIAGVVVGYHFYKAHKS